MTYGVDAARAIILDQDVMAVIEVTRFSGIRNTLVPAVRILVALDLVPGAVALYVHQRASSSKVA